jgi:hypothetical protein
MSGGTGGARRNRTGGAAGVVAAVGVLALAGGVFAWGLMSGDGSDSGSSSPAAVASATSPSALVSPGLSAAAVSPSASGPPPATAPAVMPTAQPIPTGTGTPGVPLPRVDQVDQRDATALSQGALTVWFTADTTSDTSWQDAAVRSGPWLTPEYAGQQADFAPLAGPRAEWGEWAAHRAYTVVAMVAAREAGAPADTDVEAFRQWRVTVTATGRDGWTGPPTASTAYVHLVRASVADPWRVAQVLVTA